MTKNHVGMPNFCMPGKWMPKMNSSVSLDIENKAITLESWHVTHTAMSEPNFLNLDVLNHSPIGTASHCL